jgi:uncharacterized repeat protein (TIGR01451 family)
MLTNSAAAVSDAFDENIGNNRAWNLTEVSAVADLVISAGGTPDPVDEGGLLTYTISFVNNGPSKAHDVAIIDTFPPEVQVVSANLFDILLKSAPLRDAVVFADRIICEIGDLAPGEGGTLIIVVRVPLNTLAITLTNTATIVSDSVDPDPSNNTVITQTDVNGCTLPAAPTGVLASNGVSNTTVFIVWSGVPGATHYDIYRSTVADFATAEFLGATVQTEFLDLDPEPPVIDMSGCHHIECTKAFYWVVAVNGCGDSVPSIPDEGYESLLKSASFSSQYGNLILLGLLLAGLHGFKRASRTRRTL